LRSLNLRPAGVSAQLVPATRVISCPLQDLAHAPRSGLPKWGSLVIVSDENVWFWHGHRLQLALAEALGNHAGSSIVVALLPPGEEAKTRRTKERIEDLMLAHRWVWKRQQSSLQAGAKRCCRCF
jgi:3-dehydroquinate synthetase